MEKFLENAFPYTDGKFNVFMGFLKEIPNYSMVFERQLEKNHLWKEAVEKTKDESGFYHVAYLTNVQSTESDNVPLFMVLRLLKKEGKYIPVIEVRNEEFDIYDFLKRAKPIECNLLNRKFKEYLKEIKNYQGIFAKLVREMPEWITVSDMYTVETFVEEEKYSSRSNGPEYDKELSLRIFDGGICPVIKIVKYYIS